jgi:hypothetical protein
MNALERKKVERIFAVLQLVIGQTERLREAVRAAETQGDEKEIILCRRQLRDFRIRTLKAFPPEVIEEFKKLIRDTFERDPALKRQVEKTLAEDKKRERDDDN